jgi:predicted nuclease with TOPRIM domain
MMEYDMHKRMLEMQKRIEELIAENKRLREALKEVRSMVEDHMHLDHADDALEIIDKALEGE